MSLKGEKERGAHVKSDFDTLLSNRFVTDPMVWIDTTKKPTEYAFIEATKSVQPK